MLRTHAWNCLRSRTRAPDRKKCFWQHGQPTHECKYGYPRPLHLDKNPSRDEETDRNLYECRYPEDERLSPYVPLWLLAWGANMNVQLMDHDRFLAYIAKYA